MVETKRDKYYQYHLIPKESVVMILQPRNFGRLNGKRMKLLKENYEKRLELLKEDK